MLKAIEEYGDFFIYPILLLWMIYMDSARLLAEPLWWAGTFALGWFTWTFAEYWIHRSLLHGPYWMDIHEGHHKHPKVLTRFPIWQIPSYFLAIFAAYYLVAGDWTVSSYSGFILGWTNFLLMHHTMHHWPWLIPNFAIRHNAHHKMTDMNYGIAVDWWDRVFGTYRAPKSPEPAQRSSRASRM